MLFAGNFYRVLSLRQEGQQFFIEVELVAQHPIFEGHFPGRPVVPGVVTISIIREMLSEIVSAKVRFTTLKSCKFVSAILPREGLTLAIEMTVNNDHLRAEVRQDGNPALKLSTHFYTYPLS